MLLLAADVGRRGEREELCGFVGVGKSRRVERGFWLEEEGMKLEEGGVRWCCC